MLFVRQHKYKALAFFTLWLTMAIMPAHATTLAADKSSAVIFAYQRIGEDQTPQVSLSVETFKSHIEELKSNDYTALPVLQIIEALKKGEALPEHSIGITFDGAWTSSMTNAVPLLLEAKIPFTIFFSTDMADSGSPNHATWKQIKSLAKNKLVTFGILPSAYVHMLNLTKEQNAALINKSIARFREETGQPPKIFAYPYGEVSSSLRNQISTYDFSAAFSQNSGVASAQSDMLSLPRFTMTDAYGDLDRFMLTARALPLPVTDITPEDSVLSENPPVIGFTISPEIKNLSGLSCFASGLGKLPLSKLPGNRIEIRPLAAFSDRSTRINCTIPEATITPGQPQEWRWLGMDLVDLEYKEDDTAEPAETTE